MRSFRRLFVSLLAVVAVGAIAGCAQVLPPQSNATTSVVPSQDEGAEQALVNQINAFRAAHGMPALAVHPVLVNKARFVATAMTLGSCGHDASGVANICHGPLESGITVPWTYLAENVGMTAPADVTRMGQGFEQSPDHAANMLSAQATYVGVGVAYVNGAMYVAEEFMATP